MKILLIDNGTSLLAKLQRLLPQDEVTQKWDALADFDASQFDVIVLSGSRDSSVVWQHDRFKDEIHLINSTQTPLIGICFGCELIAYSFEGTLKELPLKHDGIRQIRISTSHFLISLRYQFTNTIAGSSIHCRKNSSRWRSLMMGRKLSNI